MIWACIWCSCFGVIVSIGDFTGMNMICLDFAELHRVSRLGLGHWPCRLKYIIGEI